MKKAKKKAAEKIMSRKAKEQVEKDLNKLKGEAMNVKLKKELNSRILEVTVKISLFVIVNSIKFNQIVVTESVIYIASVNELLK